MTTPQTLKDQQKRYRTLNGDPVFMSARHVFLTSPETKTSALVSAFAAAAILPQGMGDAAMTFASGILGHTIIALIAHYANQSHLRRSFGAALERSCIDTAPDKNTPPTHPDFLMPNDTMLERFRLQVQQTAISTPLVILGTSPILQFLAGNADKIPYVSLGFCCFFLTHTIEGARGFSRHAKIDRRDWVITDMPKEIAQEQNQRISSLTPQMTA